jgi:hypothetical protein
MANKCLADDGRTTKEAPDSPSKYRRSKRKGDKQWLKPTNVYGGSGRSDVLRTRASWNHRNDPSRGGGRNRSFALCSRALDSLFGTDLKKPTPRSDMPAFDAANVLRFGQDLIYLVSATGNELGGVGYSRFWATNSESTSSKMFIMAAI